MASKENAAEVVSKVEHNQLKRKLDKAENEIQKRKKQMKLMEALIAKGFQFPTKRTRICLTVPNFTKAMEEMENGKRFSVYSDPVEVAGFEWKLEAFGHTTFFGFYLSASPPAKYAESSFEFQVEYSSHLFGNTLSRDIHETAEDFANDDENIECMHWDFSDKDDMSTFPGNFLQPDGSIEVELDFVIQSAKFYEDDDEKEVNGENTNKKYADKK